jgi:hypothetical protein
MLFDIRLRTGTLIGSRLRRSFKMKKTVVLATALAALVCVQGFSQKLMIGGEAGFSFGSRKSGNVTSDTSGFTFSPILGYAISDKFDLGGRLILEREDTGTTTTTFGVAGWGRFHLLNMGKVDARLLGEIGYSNASNNISGSKDQKSFWVALLPNFEYRVANHVSLYTNIGGIRFTRGWTDSDHSSTSFRFALEDTIGLGFIFRI